eukprot:CAMPEP_0184682940 /NCGR_PEP_ID=MMETSP0312-20130426/9317_1 /TAXON_ID=31354 /ORGANISM="Compsopogon coeruleus, Strain SAG 36.94" /LENGTH=327 /DNA_ID=CAMNT_0027134929 /DNA_START=144 /DNA_END=1127 /DNA_ORIENTATION=-
MPSRRKKRRTQKNGDEEDETLKDIPRSFVVRRGWVMGPVRELISEIRLMLSPHTAVRLKERRSNTIKDYLGVAGHLGVSHVWLVSSTEVRTLIRIARASRGPTLTLAMEAYSLMRDVRATQRRPLAMGDKEFREPPLLILNNFGEPCPHHVSIAGAVFQSLFPKINVQTVQLERIRRAVIVHLDEESGCIEIRHYAIRVRPIGLSRPVRKIVTAKRRVPRLNQIQDIADLLEDGGANATGAFSSDSEGEGPEDAQVETSVLHRSDDDLRKKRGRTSVTRKSATKLIELGPRLRLRLVRIEEGFCSGESLYSLNSPSADYEDNLSQES